MVLFWILWVLAWLPITVFFPTRVVGRKNFVKGGAVLVCNHFSNIDAPLLDIKLHRRLIFLAKAELFKTKVRAWFFGHVLGAISVDRSRADVRAIKAGLNVCKQGKKLGVFPEGTRNKKADRAEIGEIHDGAIMLASRAGVPIIPMVLLKRPRLFRFNKLVIGRPFMVSGENPNRPTQEETEAAKQQLREVLDGLIAANTKKKK